MKKFEEVPFSYEQCWKETLELQQLLATHTALEERKDILPFFRKRPHLAAYCASYHPSILRFDRIAWKYDLFGDFCCDLVVGDSVRKSYGFVEFEDANPSSIFVQQGAKATREWSARFDHGYSQIIDWFYKLNDRTNSEEFEARFGKRSINYMGILVAGRSHHLNQGERLRLAWRREHVVVHSKQIHCVTFDELLDDLLAHFNTLPVTPPAKGKPKKK